MAEGARLESVFRGNSNVGSNPTLSASPVVSSYLIDFIGFILQVAENLALSATHFPPIIFIIKDLMFMAAMLPSGYKSLFFSIA